MTAICGVVKTSTRGNVTAQDDTAIIAAVETSSTAQSYRIDTTVSSLSAVDMSSAEGEDLPSPFVDVPGLVHDHTPRHLPRHFDGLVENILVYISGRDRLIIDLACND